MSSWDDNMSSQAFISKVVIHSIWINRMRRFYANRRRARNRTLWLDFQSELSDRQFHQYFWMSPELFAHLCSEIEDLVGEHEFKWKEFLSNVRLFKLKPQILNSGGKHKRMKNCPKFLSSVFYLYCSVKLGIFHHGMLESFWDAKILLSRDNGHLQTT